MTHNTEASAPSDWQPLDWLTVSGFKSLQSVPKLQMRRINVVIGANGSGKSNLIKVFSFLEALRAGRLEEYVARAGGGDRILHFGAKTTGELTIEVSFGNEVNRYEITLVPNELDGLVPSNEKANEEPLPSVGAEAGISKDVGAGILSWIQSRLDRWRLYHFHDTGRHSPFKKTCALHDNEFLRPDGSNLPAFLYFLKTKHAESYSFIRRTIRLVTPFFDDFVLRPMRTNDERIRLEWKHVGSDSYFDVSSLSDGTLRLMAMTTLLSQPAKLLPSVILLDEPELGLHPYATTIFCSLVKAASVNAQVVLATQSPLVLDHFEPRDVLVAERRNGASSFTRLDANHLDVWLEDYSLGQLWEKNEIGGRPSVETRTTRLAANP